MIIASRLSLFHRSESVPNDVMSLITLRAELDHFTPRNNWGAFSFLSYLFINFFMCLDTLIFLIFIIFDNDINL